MTIILERGEKFMGNVLSWHQASLILRRREKTYKVLKSRYTNRKVIHERELARFK